MRSQLVELIEQGVIPGPHIERAVQLSGIHPSGRAWREFLDRLLLWLGSLSLACSVLFFIAYNWADMDRLLRFGLVEAALVLAIAGYWVSGGRGVVAQATLTAATLLLGVLLALVGQVYQTGADPWQLFFSWALLMSPWVLIGRSALLWLFWLALLNLAVLLYYQTWGNVFGALFGRSMSALWLLFGVNTLALTCWELGARRWPWLNISWPRRLLALGSGIPITWLALVAITDLHLATGWVMFTYALWLVALYAIYRLLVPELFMLAGGCLSVIAVIVVFLADMLIDHAEAGGLLLLAMVTLGLSAAAAVWLKRVNAEIEA